MNALISDLVARFSGDSFRRLNTAQAAEKAGTMATARLRELRPGEDRNPELRAQEEEARVADRAAAEALAQEKADRGERAEIEVTTPGPRMLAHVERVKALGPEYGLPEGVSASQVMGAIHDRCRVIDQELRRRYQAEGEPAGAVRLRAEIAEAKRATWPLTKAYRDAKERVHIVGLGEGEAPAMEAFAKLNEAEASVQALQRRLRDEFAIEE